MQLIRGIRSWPDDSPSVVTIGNFDGLHLGHQAMLARIRDEARARGLPSVVVTFSPLPHEYFLGDDPQKPRRIHGFRDRMMRFDGADIDRVLLLDFNEALASMTAETFIRDLLVNTLNMRFLLVGDDFRFGQDRNGDLALLAEAARKHHFVIESAGAISDGTARISSSRVRAHLAAGEFAAAAALLGRPYSISGRVVHGEKVGRELGFATANVALGAFRPIPRGVFAVRAQVDGLGNWHAGVANLGERPTLGGHRLLLEVHLFDYSGSLYGRHLEVAFASKLRDERRFDSLEELGKQIEADARAAQDVLRQP
ncbi:MAG: bifunctional riboflavin kinase/FMN adenylyltransferase [Gammaproteobacteria bacterium]|nr:MAG: bifunctional riboflavin kinase/FMN adenylyltransferase [Gammaproteobacteria bacterium]